MYMLDLMSYVEPGDELLLHLYSGRVVRGIFVDHDDYAVILINHDGSERFKRIIPYEEIEFPSIIEKVQKIKSVKKQDKKVKDDNKEDSGN